MPGLAVSVLCQKMHMIDVPARQGLACIGGGGRDDDNITFLKTPKLPREIFVFLQKFGKPSHDRPSTVYPLKNIIVFRSQFPEHLYRYIESNDPRESICISRGNQKVSCNEPFDR